LYLLVGCCGKAAYKLQDAIDLLVGEVSAEGRHISSAILDDLAQQIIAVPLNSSGAQIGNVQAGAHFRTLAMFGMAGGAACLKSLAGFLCRGL